MNKSKLSKIFFLGGCLIPLILVIILFLYNVCPYRTRTSSFFIPDWNLYVKMERGLTSCKLLFSKNGKIYNDYIAYETIRQGWQIGMQFHELYFIPPQSFYVIAEENETIMIHHQDFTIHRVNYELKDSLHITHIFEGQPIYSNYVKAFADSTFLNENSFHIKTTEHFEGLSVFDSNGTFLFSANDGSYYKGS